MIIPIMEADTHTNTHKHTNTHTYGHNESLKIETSQQVCKRVSSRVCLQGLCLGLRFGAQGLGLRVYKRLRVRVCVACVIRSRIVFQKTVEGRHTHAQTLIPEPEILIPKSSSSMS